MPKTTFISGKVVLANLIRGLGYKLPSSYADDVLEWIPEGMGLLQPTNSLVIKSTGDEGCPGELLVENHCVKLPCGFVYIIALEDEFGNRIPEGGDIRNLTSQSARFGPTSSARINVFGVNPNLHQTSDGTPTEEPGYSIPIYGEDIEVVSSSSTTNKYYQINGNYIQTSFECGFVKLHYYSLPVDEEGYPMIPANKNYELALEFHLIKRLVMSGYKHPVFDYRLADQEFEKYAARAVSEVSYPSPDSMNRVMRSTVRLIPVDSMYSDFFIGSEAPEVLRK